MSDLRDKKKGLVVVDHTEDRWSKRYRSSNRENGASTYSREIVQHHIPLWQAALSEYSAVISTCPRLLNTELMGDIAVQYLHTYPYGNALHNIQVIDRDLRMRFGRRIYITAYRSLHVQALAAGFETWHIPMAVDESLICPVPSVPQQHYGERSAAYFGNLLGTKTDPFIKLRREFHENGWGLIRVEGKQMDAWHELTKFDYGVGVGRCALEMMSLGLKVMISGSQFGGIMTNEQEFNVQRDTNFNGRVTTFDREVKSCLAAWDSSIQGVTVPVPYAVSILETYLHTL